MKILETIAKKLVPGLKSEGELRVVMDEEMKTLLAKQIKKAQTDIQVSVNYDPKRGTGFPPTRE